MHTLDFVKEFLLAPGRTGAVAASSKALAECIVQTALEDAPRVVVELGSGTGVFTEVLLQRLAPDATFFAMESNARFVQAAQARCPSANVVHDCATRLARHVRAAGHEACDAIVCGLPWACFVREAQRDLLDEIYGVLRPGGRFATFAYVHGALLPAGRAFRRDLLSRFSRVSTTRVVWTNIPPAFVYAALK